MSASLNYWSIWFKQTSSKISGQEWFKISIQIWIKSSKFSYPSAKIFPEKILSDKQTAKVCKAQLTEHLQKKDFLTC